MGLTHSPHIVTDGLTLCLDAANSRSYPGTGTTCTDLSSKKIGTLTNGPSFGDDNGGYFAFDGADDYIQFNSVSATSEATVICWWRVENGITNTNAVRHRMWKIDGNYECRVSRSDTQGSGKGSWTFDIGGSNAVYTARRSWDANVWYSIALTHNYSENYLKIYTDGVLTDSSTFGTNPNGLGSSLLVGGATTNSMYGDIASFSMYNRALSADEIRQNYLATKGRYE